eukprot:CAMPEP_0114616892 /NCGR_PEP_ID=MMETSP0168-20121206/6919_1 /TAXON_ID=95228 ORGANISM="Vannella sp., Strain DIVA3 517/6/12" /NCGR_SAMPLE_ID=MMETSP0168 /ASSEMBLY_ACC=CAM_ASM_000044 /LENGTH=845 /DNA_ID=CAMNT_0001828017 /DNA_START=15 /DNA_END=2549 /DNA_ORIENTATION=-
MGMQPGCRPVAVALRWCSSNKEDIPVEHWNSPEARQEFIEKVAIDLKLSRQHWATGITYEDLVERGGRSLVARYAGSVARMLRDILPDMGIAATAGQRGTVRHRAPRGFWNNERNRRDFLTHVAAVHGVEKPEDWRDVTRKHITELGGGSFLRRYQDSVLAALRDSFPDQEFPEGLCRPQVSRNYWEKQANRRAFLEEVAEKYDVKRASDWKRVTTQQVEAMGGSRLVRTFGGSLIDALRDAFPEQRFDELACRPTKPRGYWDKAENRRAFMDEVARAYNIVTPQDWKQITAKHVSEMGGATLLQLNGGSLLRTLRDVYAGEVYQGTPIRWDAFTCRPNLPAGHWGLAGNVKELLDRAKVKFRINSTKDWYRVSQAQLRQLQGGGLLRKMRFIDALRLAYPQEQFDVTEINKNVKKAVQRQMFMCSQRLFRGLEVVEDYRSEKLTGAEGQWPRRSLELDVYVPELELGIEYNGEHHYIENAFFGGLELYQQRDAAKRRICDSKGIKLLVVPYWWDNTFQSFVASLYWAFPEMIEAVVTRQPEDERGAFLRKLLDEVRAQRWKPIPRKPDASLNEAVHHGAVPAADQLWSGAVPRPVLVRVRTSGIRVVWNGKDQQLATRFGRKIPTPQWWRARMPANDEVDGELYLDEEDATAGKLSGLMFLSSAAERPMEEGDNPWQRVVFEATDVVPGQADADLSMRLLQLSKFEESSTFKRAAYVSCKSTKEVEDFKARVAQSNRAGATIYLRSPRGLYEYAENASTKLVRSTYETEMAVVGKSSTTRGLLVEGVAGARQVVRCTAAVYASPPPVGTVITVGHYGHWPTTGRVKFPFFVCTRPDLRWDAVVR